MASGIAPHDLTLLVALAFGLWLALTVSFRPRHVKGGALLAAVLSWLMAWAVIWLLPVVTHWIGTYFDA